MHDVVGLWMHIICKTHTLTKLPVPRHYKGMILIKFCSTNTHAMILSQHSCIH